MESIAPRPRAPSPRRPPHRLRRPPRRADKPKPLGLLVRAGLADLMRKYPEMLVFGEDVAQKGGRTA